MSGFRLGRPLSVPVCDVVGQHPWAAQVVGVVGVHRRRFAGFRRGFAQRAQVGVVGSVLVPVGLFDAAHDVGCRSKQKIVRRGGTTAGALALRGGLAIRSIAY